MLFHHLGHAEIQGIFKECVSRQGAVMQSRDLLGIELLWSFSRRCALTHTSPPHHLLFEAPACSRRNHFTSAGQALLAGYANLVRMK